MAALAIDSQAATVLVILPVTAVTPCFRVTIGSPVKMTFLARGHRVQAQERETCEIVIEAHANLPAFLVVAALTLLSLLAFVHVVGAMATDAGHVCLMLFRVALVAGYALEVLVLAAKREVGFFAVVEARILPSLCGMTVLAFSAVAALVHVVRAVAGDAGCLELYLVGILLVAALTGEAVMAVA